MPLPKKSRSSVQTGHPKNNAVATISQSPHLARSFVLVLKIRALRKDSCLQFRPIVTSGPEPQVRGLDQFVVWPRRKGCTSWHRRSKGRGRRTTQNLRRFREERVRGHRTRLEGEYSRQARRASGRSS